MFSSSQDQYLYASDGTTISNFVIPVLSDASDHGNEYEALLRKSMLQAFPDAGSSYKRLNRVIPRILASILPIDKTEQFQNLATISSELLT